MYAQTDCDGEMTTPIQPGAVNRPRLTQFHELQAMVAELQDHGLEGFGLYKRLTEIGIIDLDVLDEVMK